MPDYFYVYPAYLEEGVPRRGGRRIPAPASLRDVTAAEIVAVARSMGYAAEEEPAKHYPRQAHAYAGRVKIPKHGSLSKAAFLRSLAAEIRRRRPAGSVSAGGKR
ncbi:MAG: signal recognition particle subunit SRP19/SEC65 family protein [Thermoplasmata archaeon]